MNTAKKLSRCAVYTRKSTDHNLDLEFNSLDAQREACEAYIKSQAHEGWRLVPDHYDDGGLSGASLDRPGLQALLVDIQAGKVDIVVVYKVDRLTRSLTDFAKLIELFDRHGASFVSVTQSFNTTSSMGRLTLNVLLSFAQFEREVIGERVRDKIAASKRKGMWVGGPVPLGYASVKKKLVIIPEEAESVRTIFQRYLALGSVRALADDLDRAGIHTKRRILSNGAAVGGGRFGVGALAHLLRNRFYIGELVYRGEIHAADHEPILDRPLFEAVQARLAANQVDRKLRKRESPALLTGRIFDQQGNRLTPSHTVKNGVRYRYYISRSIIEGQSKGGRVTRVPAPEIEALIVKALRAHRATLEERTEEQTGDRDLIERHVERLIVKANAIEVTLREPTGLDGTAGDDRGGDEWERHSRPVVLTLPWVACAAKAIKGVQHSPREQRDIKPGSQEALLTAIAKARGWIDDLVTGRVTSFAEIARSERKVERHIRLLAPLAFTSPECVRAFMAENTSQTPTVTALARMLPDSWIVQARVVRGMEAAENARVVDAELS